MTALSSISAATGLIFPTDRLREEGREFLVKVEEQVTGNNELTRLVQSLEERHDTYDVLSTNSPLGQAIIGASPGSTVKYQGPKRELSVTVVGVRPLE